MQLNWFYLSITADDVTERLSAQPEGATINHLHTFMFGCSCTLSHYTSVTIEAYNIIIIIIIIITSYALNWSPRAQ